MKKFLLMTGLVLGSLLLAALIVWWGHEGRQAEHPLQQASPWAIEAQADGSSRVFGLSLQAQTGSGQGSTLADVRALWPADTQLAVVAAPGETGTLEAFVESASVGFIAGKLVVTADLPPEVVQGLRERASKAEFMDSSTRKYQLNTADLSAAWQAPILALTFVPQAQLDAEMVQGRFGTPSRRLAQGEELAHWLYPSLGLSVTLKARSTDVLQYVAPARFEALLAAPLQALAPEPVSASTRPDDALSAPTNP